MVFKFLIKAFIELYYYSVGVNNPLYMLLICGLGRIIFRCKINISLFFVFLFRMDFELKKTNIINRTIFLNFSI